MGTMPGRARIIARCSLAVRQLRAADCASPIREEHFHREGTAAEIGLADARRVLQHRLKHRLKFARRTVMTLQNLRGRGLLLQRLGKIVGALAQFVEQPRVLDGDDGLGGEVLHQFDLLVGEGANLLAIDAR